MISDKTKGYLAILFSTFLYGWFGVFVNLIGDSIPLFYQTFTRNILMSSVLGLYLIITNQTLRTKSKGDYGKIVVRFFFGFINITTALVSFQKLSIGFAYILFFFGLLLGSFAIGTFINKERVNRIKILSLGITLLGVILAHAYRTQVAGEILYITLAVISGVAVAFWNVLSQYISKDISAAVLNFSDAVLLCITSFVFSLVIKETWSIPSVSTAWIANAGLAITFIIAGTLVPYGFRRVETQLGAILTPLEIVFGVILGYLFFKDQVTYALIIGCVLIIVASILPSVWDLRDNKRIRTR